MSLVLLLFTGCTFIRVLNLSDVNLRVRVTVPDNGKGYTRFIRPGNVVDVFSGHGGAYRVTTLPDEGFKQLLNQWRVEITTRLFEEGSTLSTDDVRTLTDRLNSFDQLLQEMEQPGVSCTGYAPDFETAVVTATWDSAAQSWVLECQ